MKNKNKNGFTLIELLAVIIILIIVIFIAITKVRNSSLKAQLDAMKASAGAYIKAINNTASNVNIQEESPFESGLLRYSVLSSLDVNVTGTKPSDGYVIMSDYEVTDACFEYGDYFVSFNGSEVGNPTEGTCGIDSLQKEFAYTGSVQKFTVEKSGKYKIELWGAQGGQGANGGYTTGDIELTAGTNLYFFVGGEGPSNQTVTNVGGYNGGGYSGNNSGSYSYGGGGATDVRLVNSPWNNPQSLRSRIMVAGGGGGTFSTTSYTKIPGVGGNVNGGDADGSYSATVPGGGKQTGPGTGQTTSNQGSFGYATQVNPSGFGGGGGGGYWGGSTGHGRAGAGGSSYISGYQGCVAVISEDSNSPRLNSANTTCTEDTSDLDCSYHYSGYVFTNPDMKSGEESMPTHDGTSTMIGNSGNGYAKITFLNNSSSSGVYTYNFSGAEVVFKAPKTATYKLEVWGAEGGTVTDKYYGGYGGYSTGTINLKKDDKLYVNVGGKGYKDTTTDSYNGGGYGTTSNGSSGGGATSIALSAGEIKNVKKANLVIVAGGGGGSVFYNDGYASGWGGHGGGYIGNDSTPDGWSQGGSKGGTQTEGGRYGLNNYAEKGGNNGSYGQGGNTSGYSNYAAGGGGGFYGGGSGRHASGAGGSGYIGYSKLNNKVMYCYNCAENNDEDTKTTSTTCVNTIPTANCAKKGSGYAKITMVE